jgi:hypothetical protein
MFLSCWQITALASHTQAPDMNNPMLHMAASHGVQFFDQGQQMLQRNVSTIFVRKKETKRRTQTIADIPTLHCDA